MTDNQLSQLSEAKFTFLAVKMYKSNVASNLRGLVCINWLMCLTESIAHDGLFCLSLNAYNGHCGYGCLGRGSVTIVVHAELCDYGCPQWALEL